jgi:hypothetical protein
VEEGSDLGGREVVGERDRLLCGRLAGGEREPEGGDHRPLVGLAEELVGGRDRHRAPLANHEPGPVHGQRHSPGRRRPVVDAGRVQVLADVVADDDRDVVDPADLVGERDRLRAVPLWGDDRRVGGDLLGADRGDDVDELGGEGAARPSFFRFVRSIAAVRATLPPSVLVAAGQSFRSPFHAFRTSLVAVVSASWCEPDTSPLTIASSTPAASQAPSSASSASRRSRNASSTASSDARLRAASTRLPACVSVVRLDKRAAAREAARSRANRHRAVMARHRVSSRPRPSERCERSVAARRL